MKLKENESVWVLGGFLGLVGILSALVLSWVSAVTAEPIRLAVVARQQASLSKLLPDFTNNPLENYWSVKSPDGKTIDFYGACNNGELVAVAAAAVNPRGYSGDIEIMLGITPDGKVINLLVTSENETPGLGKVVCTREFQKTLGNLFDAQPEGLPPNKYLDQFSGLSYDMANPWASVKNGGRFIYRTGATVSSEAVIEAVGAVLKCYSEHRQEILSHLECR